MLRPARLGDLPEIEELLSEARLPTAGVSLNAGTFFVIESGSSIVGVGGIELYGSSALLRSIAVSRLHRGRGHAAEICDRLEAVAATRGIEQLYLLTETAADFFSKRGYAALPRDEAPPQIASSEEFTELCPDTAIFMRRST